MRGKVNEENARRRGGRMALPPAVIQKIKISIKDPMWEAWQAGQKQTVNSPIDADGTEIEDARRAHHHIQSDKDVTVDLAEAPLSHHLEENKQQQTEDSSERQRTEQSRPTTHTIPHHPLVKPTQSWQWCLVLNKKKKKKENLSPHVFD